MTCNICKRSTYSLTPTPSGKACNMCAYLLHGIRMNSVADVSYTTDDGIVLWIKDNNVVEMWKDDGQTRIPSSTLVNRSIGEALELVRSHKLCSICGDVVDRLAGSHMAGKFCHTCWEEYKSSHSDICSMCHRPYYECVC